MGDDPGRAARLLTKEGDRQQASAVLGDALAHLRSVDAPPLPRIVVAVETLAVSPAAGVPALLAELVGRLRSVTPRRARMSTLAEFWRVPVLADQGLLGEDLLRVIAPLDDEQGSPVDVSPLDLAADAWVHAEVLRASAGRTRPAGSSTPPAPHAAAIWWAGGSGWTRWTGSGRQSGRSRHQHRRCSRRSTPTCSTAPRRRSPRPAWWCSRAAGCGSTAHG